MEQQLSETRRELSETRQQLEYSNENQIANRVYDSWKRLSAIGPQCPKHEWESLTLVLGEIEERGKFIFKNYLTEFDFLNKFLNNCLVLPDASYITQKWENSWYVLAQNIMDKKGSHHEVHDLHPPIYKLVRSLEFVHSLSKGPHIPDFFCNILSKSKEVFPSSGNHLQLYNSLVEWRSTDENYSKVLKPDTSSDALGIDNFRGKAFLEY
jgi:hypothetical protein